jgi:L-fucose mutarotase/ribose pyranase (RbsD/FucU family)
MDRRQVVTGLAAAPFASVRGSDASATNNEDWKKVLSERIPLYGHRNWIVVADSAYPAQSRTGIETLVSGASHLDVLRTVLAALAASRHVRPIVYQDRELSFVQERDAPGVEAYRRQLATMFRDVKVNTFPHEEIISKLDQAGQVFEILIIKSMLTIPYTSVFLQLDCAYWSQDAESALRVRMASQG